jgi:putative restriction endonuclease
MTDFALDRNLTIGETLSQDEVESVFQTDFGYQFKGITYRNTEQGRYIILMANDGEIYDDKIGSGSGFVYYGEGVEEKGDQQLTTSNRALRDAITEAIPVYFFESEEGVDEYEYQGLVDVTNCRYESDGARMIYKFDVEKLGVETWEKVEQVQSNVDVDDTASEEPELTEDQTTYTQQEVRVRSKTFAQKVKQTYDYTCVVCGASRFSPEGNPEVEAAHIYPKREGGSDDVRNGVALCKLHHWAFDTGWLSFSDEHKILVKDATDRSVYDEFKQFEGDQMHLLDEAEIEPHPIFLERHRQLNGFIDD